MILFSIVLWVYSLIGRSEELRCSTDCFNFYVRHNGSIDPSSCSKTESDICKARITAYYNGKTIPNYFNYTFGFTGGAHEAIHREFIRNYGLTNFTEYQFILHLKRGETILVADIYCTNEDDCGWIEVQQLVEKYTKQTNPLHHFQPFVYSDSSPTKLICYDSNSDTDMQCTSADRPVCIWNSTSALKACSSGLDAYVHYKFTVSSPDTTASKRAAELVICNIDHCNTENMLMKLDGLPRSYTHRGDTKKNTGNRNTHQSFLGLWLLIIYCIR